MSQPHGDEAVDEQATVTEDTTDEPTGGADDSADGSRDEAQDETVDEAPDDESGGTAPEASGGTADGTAAPELSGTPTERLAQLGIELPAVPSPVADYVPAVRSGSLVYTSGQLPFVDGVLRMTGVVGDQPVDVTPQEAAVLARQCALNAIAVVASLVDLDQVVRVVKVTGFVASAPGFSQQPVVVNGASELLGQVFGEAGRHARSAVGVAALPLNAPVEVEIVVEVG